MSILIGNVYGRWSVIKFSGIKSFPSDKKVNLWLCRCTCGTERPVLQTSLLRGSSTSCGCYAIERSKQVNTKHGASSVKTPEYYVWQAMKDRCNNPNNPRYADYGGRGITVDSSWEFDFSAFVRDMGLRPTPQHQIERKDNDLGYNFDNCKWALPHENMTNRRNTRYVDDIPLATLAKEYDIPANTLRFRILKGWSLDEALNKPVRFKRSKFRRAILD